MVTCNVVELTIKTRLLELAEEKYRIFSSGLLPNVNNILGVRLPVLRKLAKEITQGPWESYLETASSDYFEEIMLQGMVIGCAKGNIEELLPRIADFIPLIDNWSVCDSFCVGLKCTKKHPERIWDFLQGYFLSEKEFEVRFGVVMLLFYYIDKQHIAAVLKILNHVRHEGYYAKMAVAWAISICYIKFPEQTMGHLRKNKLDDFTYNKALQKITESYRVAAESKQIIRSMKRK